MAKTTKKKYKKKKLTSEERKALAFKRAHVNLVRSVFRNAGFKRYPKLADKEFTLGDLITSDFDDVYLYENLLICIEYTTSKSDLVSDHLKKKKIVYDKVADDKEALVSAFCDLDEEFKEDISATYNVDELVVRCLYCSRHDFAQKHKEITDNANYLDYPELRYFKSLTDSIKRSALPELIDFLDVKLEDLGVDGNVSAHATSKSFQATVLPEANSNFDKGFKVVTFYVDPETLLEQAYVLRRQGWRDSESVYQRMISKAKIDQIRKHLKAKKRVFVNNIIATLDDETKILDANGDTVDPKNITKTETVDLQLPNKINTVGLIDGQHRTFSYYVSNPDDVEVAKLRKRQNLLVTGIIYPPGKSARDREAFEARLFLEINSTQTNAKSDLKQAINRIVDPFSDESIASTVVERLGRGSGPLSGQIVRHWFDTDKLKTTSIVSYGMKPLTKTSGTDSIFSLWTNPNKADLKKSNDTALLDEYIQFCCDTINDYLIAVRKTLPSGTWTPNRKNGGLLTTTVMNSLLICLRTIIENGKTGNTAHYESKFAGLTPKSFEGFHSSQYGKLAERLYKAHFA
ncbi:DGQHR domain-containing protein [Thalassovita sp.]|uniref:DGQHR domain-containing protein n=1 Tax=Thalassovita sp. TaxID=1979401 RepID=UPI002B26D941|nr:DGQHR domain-containing protein [Thalassovita sp.]